MYGNILQSERCCPALARFRRFATPQLFALTEYLFCAFLNHWRDELAQQLGSALASFWCKRGWKAGGRAAF